MTVTPNPNDLPAVLEQLQQAEPDLLRSIADRVCAGVDERRCRRRLRRRVRQPQPGADQSAQRLPVAGVGHSGRRDRAGDPEAPRGLLLPRLAVGAPQTSRTRADLGRRDVYLLGVSTRRMEKLVEQLGITGLSKSQVSIMAKNLDAQVEAFRTRPLDAGPYTFVAADA